MTDDTTCNTITQKNQGCCREMYFPEPKSPKAPTAFGAGLCQSGEHPRPIAGIGRRVLILRGMGERERGRKGTGRKGKGRGASSIFNFCLLRPAGNILP